MSVQFDNLNQRRAPVFLGAVIVLFFLLHVTDLLSLGLVQRLEQIAYDVRLKR
ncbi:MAG: hypothetical protein GWN04_05865, partial [Gammaproteobacteria bacterium]|nr:hypothetical protein [Gammaproteobacteria bacterium]NIX17830.1 hypothetical protein [Gammaproteobacteria bacterium]